MNRIPLQALFLKQPGSFLGDLLAQGLAAAGVPAVTVGSPYDVVIEAERAGGAFSHIIVRVDYFGRDEFRLMPLVRREWPETILVAYHSGGFEHKGLLADLLGADLVVASTEDAARFLEALGALRKAGEAPAPLRPAAPTQPPADAGPQQAAKPPTRPETEPLLAQGLGRPDRAFGGLARRAPPTPEPAVREPSPVEHAGREPARPALAERAPDARPSAPAAPAAPQDAAGLDASLEAALAQAPEEVPARDRRFFQVSAPPGPPAPVPPSPAAESVEAGAGDLARPKAPPPSESPGPEGEPVIEVTEEELRMLLGQEDDA